MCLPAQEKDSLQAIIDSTMLPDSSVSTLVKDSVHLKDSIKSVIASAIPKEYAINKILTDNKYLNTTSKPATFIQSPRKRDSKDSLFYSLFIIIFLFALLKLIYERYFSNLFRVFFNTSLRQGQLTDQLLQAKFPSLLYNFFFIVMGSCYTYLMLNNFGNIKQYSQWEVLMVCAIAILIIYLGKFAILKFTGWITGYKQEADSYIFIVFLINKIVAVCLIPLVVIIAFSEKNLAYIAMILSFVVIGMMLLMRFFRSYSLLQHRLKVSRLHFFIYIIGIEIVPLLVIYKAALVFMSKNL